ncbi:uncharacterized protein L201_003493 [Kwoniella dendrophila CBS 6074]|uniref:C2 domain-containing protein n=1 Tax=Kwoniella dendrophila CBS 6074 TaxID=1295534 RepID=A0AAX4JTP4_9TREE
MNKPIYLTVWEIDHDGFKQKLEHLPNLDELPFDRNGILDSRLNLSVFYIYVEGLESIHRTWGDFERYCKAVLDRSIVNYIDICFGEEKLIYDLISHKLEWRKLGIKDNSSTTNLPEPNETAEPQNKQHKRCSVFVKLPATVEEESRIFMQIYDVSMPDSTAIKLSAFRILCKDKNSKWKPTPEDEADFVEHHQVKVGDQLYDEWKAKQMLEMDAERPEFTNGNTVVEVQIQPLEANMNKAEIPVKMSRVDRYAYMPDFDSFKSGRVRRVPPGSSSDGEKCSTIRPERLLRTRTRNFTGPNSAFSRLALKTPREMKEHDPLSSYPSQQNMPPIVHNPVAAMMEASGPTFPPSMPGLSPHHASPYLMPMVGPSQHIPAHIPHHGAVNPPWYAPNMYDLDRYFKFYIIDSNNKPIGDDYWIFDFIPTIDVLRDQLGRYIGRDVAQKSKIVVLNDRIYVELPYERFSTRTWDGFGGWNCVRRGEITEDVHVQVCTSDNLTTTSTLNQPSKGKRKENTGTFGIKLGESLESRPDTPTPAASTENRTSNPNIEDNLLNLTQEHSSSLASENETTPTTASSQDAEKPYGEQLERITSRGYIEELIASPGNTTASNRLLRIMQAENVSPASSFGLKLLDLAKALKTDGELAPSKPAEDVQLSQQVTKIGDQLNSFADMVNHIAEKVGVDLAHSSDGEDDEHDAESTPMTPAPPKSPSGITFSQLAMTGHKVNESIDAIKSPYAATRTLSPTITQARPLSLAELLEQAGRLSQPDTPTNRQDGGQVLKADKSHNMPSGGESGTFNAAGDRSSIALLHDLVSRNPFAAPPHFGHSYRPYGHHHQTHLQPGANHQYGPGAGQRPHSSMNPPSLYHPNNLWRHMLGYGNEPETITSNGFVPWSNSGNSAATGFSPYSQGNNAYYNQSQRTPMVAWGNSYQ